MVHILKLMELLLRDTGKMENSFNKARPQPTHLLRPQMMPKTIFKTSILTPPNHVTNIRKILRQSTHLLRTQMMPKTIFKTSILTPPNNVTNIPKILRQKTFQNVRHQLLLLNPKLNKTNVRFDLNLVAI
jgi:hypothetical protein